MTPNELREAAKVLIAAADGKKIEYTGIHGTRTEWWHHNGSNFYFDTYDYRVKPGPLECWIVLSPKGQIKAHPTINSAENWLNFGDKIIHMREVKK